MRRLVRPSYADYKKYRIYQSLSTAEVVNNLAVLMSCKFDALVDNAPNLYKTSTKVLGSNLTNSLMLHTYGTKFVAGVDAEGLRRTINNVNAQGMGVVVYYLAEALDGKVFDESDFDYFLTKYIESIREARVNPMNGAAVRATALGNFEVIKKMNTVQEKINKLFQDSAVEPHTEPDVPERVPRLWASVDKIAENLKALGIQFEQAELDDLISKIKQPKLDSLRKGNHIHLIEWNTNFGCWNLVHPELNDNNIWKQLSRYSKDEVTKITNYLKRYEVFFDKCTEYGIVSQ